jgi:hypothetical protein
LRAFRWAPGSGELLDIGVERDGPESGGWMSARTAGKSRRRERWRTKGASAPSEGWSERRRMRKWKRSAASPEVARESSRKCSLVRAPVYPGEKPEAPL